ncbi:MAG: transposase [Chloroflexi bacterium]|nr:transposase [Chloroflexota bacterium]MCI0726539.1 transposase [Chloroflexota bacterium]
MHVQRAYKTELKPNNQQQTLLLGCTGAARFVYNWGLRQKIDEYQASGKSPSFYELHRRLNTLKQGELAWLYNYSKTIPQEALRDLDRAFAHFFRRLRQGEKPGHPRFKSRKRGIGSFRVWGHIRVEQARIKLPRLGWLRLKEKGYLPTGGVKVLSATVSERAGRWFVSLQVEEEIEEQLATGPAVAIDLGIAHLATTSDGRVFENPRALQNSLEQLARLNRQLQRRQKGSRNRAKTQARLARLHYRIACLRREALHQTTAAIVARTKPEAARPAVVVIESLNVAGMMQNEKLARAMADVGLGEFGRQMAYKCHWSGSRLMQADCWFPSSKRCSGCGQVKTELSLSERVYRCPTCDLVIDRDLNAARNLAQLATGSSSGSNACGDGEVHSFGKVAVVEAGTELRWGFIPIG